MIKYDKLVRDLIPEIISASGKTAEIEIVDNKVAFEYLIKKLDEEVTEAMLREIKEELGITLLEYKLFNIYSGLNHHHIYPNGDEVSCIDIVYVCERFEGEISLQKEEVRQVKWFNKETLPENIHHNCKQAILEYLSQF